MRDSVGLDGPEGGAQAVVERFPVDGTLIEAFACKNIRASMKSFRPKDGSGQPPAPGRNGERDFHKEQRTNETHASTSDPEARLYRAARAGCATWVTC
jgi:hypothetical protein